MLFKKKQQNSNPLDKLTIGTLLTCNTLRWKIVEISRYDWSTDGHSIEYKLESTDAEAHEAFIEVERVANGYEVLFYEWISIDGVFLLEATKSGNITYLEEAFELDEQYKGSVKNETLRTEWQPVESFIFYDKNDAMLSIEKTDEDGCQAYFGYELEEKSITNIILP